MADPYMLDPSNFATMFEPDPELVRRANEQAKAMAALRMGLGMLGKEPLGSAAQGGFRTYFATQEDARRNAEDQQKMQMQKLQVMKALEAEKRAQALRAQYAQALDPNRARVEQMAPGGPTPENAQRIQPAEEWRRYQDAALAAASSGDRETAKTFSDIASKLQPKYDTTPRPVKDKNGNVRLALFSENAPPKFLDDMTPAEKLHFFSTNEQAGIGVDQYTGERVSSGLPQGISPADRQRLAIAWAQEKRAAAAEGRPQIVATNEGNIYAVDPKKATGVPVLGPDKQPLTKGDKPLTETQAKATAYANQMFAATAEIDDLSKKGFTGKSFQQQFNSALAGTEGIPYVPGSAAIPRAMASSKAQQYDQAKMMWTEAALRFMTGAAAPEPEVRRNMATYFPMPGDAPAKVKQKAEMRKTMEESIRMAAGPGVKKLSPMPSGSASDSISTATAPLTGVSADYAGQLQQELAMIRAMLEANEE